MFPRRFAVALSLPFLAFSLAAEIRGSVTDPDGRPVAGALVHLIGGPHGTSARTDAKGAYSFRAGAGRYTLVAGAPGLAGRPATVDYDGRSAVADLRLELAARTESVVVTAERAEMPASAAASSTSVITRDDLDRIHAENVEDALRVVPGLVVNQTGGRGNVGAVFARGANANMNLVLVDGVPVNQFGGVYNFAALPAENVERIEVVRGPQSALYGANAIGAVIHIITRRPGAPALRAEAEGGSFGTARGYLGAGGRFGRFGINADLSRLNTNGQVFNDDFRNATASLSASWETSAASRLTYSFTANAYESGSPGPWGSNPIGAFSGINRIARAKENSYRHSFAWEGRSGRVLQRFHGGLYDQDFVFRSQFGESHTGNRRGLISSLTEIALTPADTLAAGFEYQRERVRNTFVADTAGRGTPIERRNAGYFVENRWERGGRIFLNAGLRLEDIRTAAVPAIQFGTGGARPATQVLSVNPKVSVAFLPRAAGPLRLHASSGTGLRSPDGFEIAFTDNPELRPEHTTSVDVGVSRTFLGRRLEVDITYFHNRFRDLIVTLGPSTRAASRWSSDNVANARAHGMELSYAWRPWRELSVAGHYTWLSTRLLDLDGAPGRAAGAFRVGQSLLRRPDHSAAYRIAWQRGRWTLDTGAEFRSRTLDVEASFGASGGLFNNPGFVRPEVGVEVTLARGMAAYARVRNFSDSRYEESFGFPSLSRTLAVGLRFGWTKD